MSPTEIQDICVDSSNRYLNFLNERGRGESTISVHSIKQVENIENNFSLQISAKIFEIDSIKFRLIDSDTKLITTTLIQIVEYDIDHNTIVVQPRDEFKHYFKEGNQNNVFLISDLKFLVERVRNWYELNGGLVTLPNKASDIKFDESLLISSRARPSEFQINAIQTIFKEPLSYIWGAPGTGKTQYVLSYAIIHYIKAGKRVGIFAPTNNAIEQVLSGVLKMAKDAGIDNRQFLRLGSPSRNFANKYPEVCEAKGLQKAIEEIANQISILEGVIQHRNLVGQIKNAYGSLSLFEIINIHQEERLKLYESVKLAEQQLQTVEYHYSAKTVYAKSISVVVEQLQRSTSSLGHSLKKFFYASPTNEEISLRQKLEELNTANKNIDELKVKADQLKKGFKQLKDKFDDISEINKLFNEVKQKVRPLEKIYQIALKLDVSNFNKVYEDLKKSIKEESDNLPKGATSALNYTRFSDSDLRIIINQQKKQKQDLLSQTTAIRLQSANVIASTLDCYIGRYSESDLPIEHIFLDEAGYANIIKSLTLFRGGNKPITFLGDHKQLPPVCEMDTNDIQEVENQSVFLWAQSSILLESIFIKNKNDNFQAFIKGIDPPFNVMYKADLTVTHRFGNNLAEVLQKHIYKSIAFKASSSNGDTNIYYIDAKSYPIEKAALKRQNEAEAIKIKEIVNSKTLKQDFVILSPYKNQIKLLGKHLPEQLKLLNILTVHGSQGREWDTVILSVSDSENKYFTDSNLSIGKNLINTSVSRAKMDLIIVCNYSYWISQKGQLIYDLLKIAKPYII